MAFDAATPSFAPAPVSLATPFERTFQVRGGGDISIVDRVVLTLGYTAFGAAIGGAAALMIGSLASPDVVTFLAAAPLVAAIALAAFCAMALKARGAALLTVAVIAALASPIGVFLLSSNAMLDASAIIFAGALVALSVVYCRQFVAAFAVAVLGLLLAAPMGAASVVWAFGQ